MSVIKVKIGGVWYPVGPGAVADAVLRSLIDAKGDLIVGTADDTVARLPVGSNGQILTADSAQAAGIKWAAPASSGHTIQDETTPLTARANLNFAGSAVAVTDDAGNDRTTVTIVPDNASSVIAAAMFS